MPMRIYINCNLWQYKRSSNPTSTASQLMLVSPTSSHHHHLHPLQLNSLLTTCNYPARCLSPLFRDVGLIENAPRKYRNTNPSHICPSPLQRDVGICSMLMFCSTLAYQIKNHQPIPTMVMQMMPAWGNKDPMTKSRITQQWQDPMKTSRAQQRSNEDE